MNKFFFGIIILCSLTACNSKFASNGEKKYLSNRNGDLLVVPPPLTNANISHYYDLSEPKGNPEITIVPPVTQAVHPAL